MAHSSFFSEGESECNKEWIKKWNGPLYQIKGETGLFLYIPLPIFVSLKISSLPSNPWHSFLHIPLIKKKKIAIARWHGHPFYSLHFFLWHVVPFVQWIIVNFLETLLVHFYFYFYCSGVYSNKSMTWSILWMHTPDLLEVVQVASIRLLLNTSLGWMQNMMVVDRLPVCFFGICWITML